MNIFQDPECRDELLPPGARSLSGIYQTETKLEAYIYTILIISLSLLCGGNTLFDTEVYQMYIPRK